MVSFDIVSSEGLKIHERKITGKVFCDNACNECFSNECSLVKDRQKDRQKDLKFELRFIYVFQKTSRKNLMRPAVNVPRGISTEELSVEQFSLIMF